MPLESQDASLASDETVAAEARPRRREGGDLHGTVVGRYVVVARLGAGGMGVVYAAYDPKLDRRVALKVLHADDEGEGQGEGEGNDGSTGHDRLLREAQALAKLQHPNVVALHDVGEHHGRVFLAMEYVDGLTLNEWRARAKPAWSEVLSVYMRAGAGLAAAHAQGLVHRDFKPENVMVTLEGGHPARVQVLDFGLARASADAPQRHSESKPERDTLSSEITAAGDVMGTPAYMAPEQHLGTEVGPPSDQFSFCVALYEALYETRPFVWDTVAELAGAVLRDDVQEPPRGSPPPRWLWPVLRRGLSSEAELRHPSMEALLDELRSDRHRRRRRTLAGVAGLGCVAALASVALIAEAREERRCRRSAQALSDQLSGSQRDELAAAVLATEVAFAERAATSALGELEDYADRWASVATGACATSARVRPRIESCLASQRAQFEEMLDQLAAVDATTVAAASMAPASLPFPEHCADLDRLPPATADTTTQRAGELRARLARLEALVLTGRYALAHERGSALLEDVVGEDMPRLEARTRIRLADAKQRDGDPDGAEAELVRALHMAIRNQATLIAAAAASRLTFLLGYVQARADEGLMWASLADMWLDAAGVDAMDERRAELLDARAMVDFRRGELAAARPALERSRDIRLELLGPDHPHVASSLARLAVVAFRDRRLEQAAELQEQVIEMQRATLGEDHPRMGESLNNLAGMYWELGRPQVAVDLLMQAIAARERGRGTDHPSLATPLMNLAGWQAKHGDMELAQQTVQRAYDISVAALGREHADTALVLRQIAEVNHAAGDDGWDRILAEVIELQTAALGEEHVEVASSLFTLGRLLLEDRRFEEAAPRIARAVAMHRALAGPDAGLLGAMHDWNGRAQFALSDYTGAEASFVEALRIAEIIDADADPRAELHGRRAYNFLQQGEVDAAIVEYRKAQELCRTACPERIEQLLEEAAFGYVLALRPDDAIALTDENRAWTKSRGEDVGQGTRLNRAAADFLSGRAERARPVFEAARTQCQGPTPPSGVMCRDALRWLGEMALADGDSASAVEHLTRARSYESPDRHPPHTDEPQLVFALARALDAAGRRSDPTKSPRRLATKARDMFAARGEGWRERIAEIDDWLEARGGPDRAPVAPD